MPNSKRRQVSRKLRAEVYVVYGTTCWLGFHGCKRIADTVDHIVPVNIGGKNTLANLRPACGYCNRRRADRVISGFGANVHMVIGPPCAGKTTFVRTHAADTDVVIDFDQLASALMNQTQNSHDFAEYINLVAQGAWAGAQRAATRLGYPTDVWIIKALPVNQHGELLIDEYATLRYQIHVIDPGAETVMQRLEQAHRQPEAKQAARQWYRLHISQETCNQARKRRQGALDSLVERSSRSFERVKL